jgi:thiamine-monophosphate kinase
VAGEFEFINWLRQRQSAQPPWVRLGIGDDLAVLDWPRGDLLLAGIDQVLDQVHFDAAVHTPRQIGRKAVNRNLSDCAAMACLPAAALASVALPRGVGLDYAKELYLGMEEAAGQFECVLIGGDTGSWQGKLALTVAILGRTGGIEPVSRGGAHPGDSIFVSGPLGGSWLGRHMTFTPRIELARQLAAASRPSAMIDLSDGLSRDLAHLCSAGGVGAILDADAIPIHPDALAMAAQSGSTALRHALHDGEDYELLLTCPPDRLGSPLAGGLVRIGQATAEPGIFLRQNSQLLSLEPLAWQHTL